MKISLFAGKSATISYTNYVKGAKMDNQQATDEGASTTIRETPDLVRLFETDGDFTIRTQMLRGDKAKHTPAVTLEGKDLKQVEPLMKQLGLAWHFVNLDQRKKPIHRIEIVGFKRVIRFLNTMKDFWVGLQMRKIRLLTLFCESRLAKPQEAPYSDRENQIAHEIKVVR